MHLPTNVAHRLILSTSPTEDLAQSDSDALLNLPPPVLIPYPIDSPTPEEGTMALQLELTLGSSTYATMALREVLKTRTSAKSQKDLTVEMEKRVEAEGIELEEAKEAAREALETVVVLDESKQVGEPIIVD
jgi:tRNA pseudouridine13 synthase